MEYQAGSCPLGTVGPCRSHKHWTYLRESWLAYWLGRLLGLGAAEPSRARADSRCSAKPRARQSEVRARRAEPRARQSEVRAGRSRAASTANRKFEQDEPSRGTPSRARADHVFGCRPVDRCAKCLSGYSTHRYVRCHKYPRGSDLLRPVMNVVLVVMLVMLGFSGTALKPPRIFMYLSLQQLSTMYLLF